MTLITPEELATYVQRPLSRAAAELIISLVEDALYGAPDGLGSRITDPPQRGFRGLALEVARRAIQNPNGVQTESANGTAVTLFPNNNRGVDLTDREVAKLRDLVGDSTTYSVDLLDEGMGVAVDWPPRLGPGALREPGW